LDDGGRRAVTGFVATSSDAAVGASLAVAGGAERLAVAVGGLSFTASLAVAGGGGGASLAFTGAADRLAEAFGGGMSWVETGGQTLSVVAGRGEALSVEGGGASDSGGASEV
jgi:hypothetical protein